MDDLLKETLKKIKKQMQKNSVQAIGIAAIQQSNNKKKNAKKQGKEATDEAKQAISQAATGIQSTVKGQFGGKITEMFEKQQKSIDSL